MGPVNVVFSTQKGLLSQLIRWVTRSEVSHCLITFYDETLDKVLAMEANRGFQVLPWRRWLKDNRLVERYGLDVPVGEQVASLQNLADYLGVEYDYTSLLGFAWRRWRKRYRNPLSSVDKLICSEAVAMFLKDAGLPIDDVSTYTPEDLRAILKLSPRAKRLEWNLPGASAKLD